MKPPLKDRLRQGEVCTGTFLLFFFGFVYCGTALSRLRSYAEHRFADNHEERTAIVERSPLFGLLFLYNNLHVLHHRVPGLPWYMLPFIVPIEVFSFLLRPITLSLRLFGNMLGGHVALKVFAGFVIALGSMAAAGGLGLLGIPGAAVSLGGIIALTALELLVAGLQAFVFAILTTIYLNDAVSAGHGH